jgi:single-strand DNA-binding protein
MASVNKVILMGNLGRDPEVRYLPSGDPVANITIATSSRYKGKTGEMASQYLKKGRPVYVEGRIKTNKYTDKNGVERYSTDIIASEMQLLGGREGMGEPSHGDGDEGYSRQAPPPPQRPAAAPQRQAPAAQPAPAARPSSGFDDMDDDIPF